MLIQAVESYLAVRRAAGFELKSEGNLLRSFAGFSDASGKHFVCAETAGLHDTPARRIYAMSCRRRSLVRRAGHVPFLTYFPGTTSGASYKRHLSWVVGIPSGGRPTAHFFPCWRAPAFAYQKRFICAFRTSLQTVWSFAVQNFAKAVSFHCTKLLKPV